MSRGAAAVLVVLCFACPAQPAAASSRAGIVVRARTGASAAQLRRSLAARGLALVAHIPHTRLYTVQSDGRSRASALRVLRLDPRVARAMPDAVVHAFDTPNDPYFSTGESYLSTIRLPQAWDLSHGSTGVTVAVVDTGVTPMPDLSTQVLPGHNVIAGNDDARDDSVIGHGTLVAGVAAASTNNGMGIAGAAWNASVLPVKVLDSRGYGTASRVAAGIVWAADNGARVINLSLGGSFAAKTICDATSYAQSRGALVVAAVGNDGDTKLNYPAACPGVVGVSATDAHGDFAWFSSFGRDVALAAPGLDITSVMNNSGYGTESGTSFSAPIVSGVAALLMAQHPEWSAAQVEQRLEGTAQDRGPSGIDPYYGYGLLDAYAALGGQPQAPAIPQRDALEPNDDATHATRLRRIARATIAPEGDVDWYVIVLRRPSRVTFDVAAPANDPDTGPNLLTAARLYDARRNRLETVASENARAELTARLRAGRYYLRIANDCGARSAGTYSVTVSMHPWRRVAARVAH